MKYFNFKRYKFTSILKKINFKRYDISKVYKHINIKRLNLSRFYRYFDIRKINYSNLFKFIDYKKYKLLTFYAVLFVIFLAISYLSFPFFYKYNKSVVEKVCKDFNVVCSVEGKIKYNFIPTPRIKISNLIIQDFIQNKKNFAEIKEVTVTISFLELLDKNKFIFNKIYFDEAKFNIDLTKFKEYNLFLKRNLNLIPITFRNSEIQLFDDLKYLASLNKVNLNYKSNKNFSKAVLKGNFLGDNIFVESKNNIKNKTKNLIFKLTNLNLLAKAEIVDSKVDENIFNIKALLKKGKNQIIGTFDYKNNKVIIKNANLRSKFLEGKCDGKIEFLPYFNFDLNVDLNTINFNTLGAAFINLKDYKKSKIFNLNKKINGKLDLSSNKIVSNNTLIKSFESKIKFMNGNIIIDRMLLNLAKKLGAADITGIIENEKDSSNFKFEKNIFIDNSKRFYNKFGIYNKEDSNINLFVSGNFDLINLVLRLNEIYDDKNFEDDDVSYVEKEFNDLLLEDGYKSLFNFSNVKEFVKLISAEVN